MRKQKFEIWDKIMMNKNMGTTRKHKKKEELASFGSLPLRTMDVIVCEKNSKLIFKWFSFFKIIFGFSWFPNYLFYSAPTE
jgi:hypothetical protein